MLTTEVCGYFSFFVFVLFVCLFLFGCLVCVFWFLILGFFGVFFNKSIGPVKWFQET